MKSMPLDDSSLDTASDEIEFSKDEATSFSDRLKYKDKLKSELSPAIKNMALEVLLKDYPGLGKDAKELKYRSSYPEQEYTKLPYKGTEIIPGDICSAHDYSILIPSGDIFQRAMSIISDFNQYQGFRRVFKYVELAYCAVPDCGAKADSKELLAAILNVFHKSFSGKEIRLEEVISGNLPAVCFEKSIILSLLINNDISLSAQGIKAEIRTGKFLEDNRKGKRGGHHAWIKLYVPKGLETVGFNNASYILDPTSNDIFIIDNSVNPNQNKFREISYEERCIYRKRTR